MSMPSICRSVGHLGAGGFHQGREHVDQVHHLVADLAGRHLAGPADEARRAVRALERGEVAAPPRPGEALPLTAGRVGVDRRHPVGRSAPLSEAQTTIVSSASPSSSSVSRILPVKASIWVSRSAKLPRLVLPCELRVRDRRDVDLRVGQVHVERLVVVLRPGHEVDRPVGDLAVEPGAELRVVGGDASGFSPFFRE